MHAARMHVEERMRWRHRHRTVKPSSRSIGRAGVGIFKSPMRIVHGVLRKSLGAVDRTGDMVHYTVFAEPTQEYHRVFLEYIVRELHYPVRGITTDFNSLLSPDGHPVYELGVCISALSTVH